MIVLAINKCTRYYEKSTPVLAFDLPDALLCEGFK
jgi:hypothetical protein